MTQPKFAPVVESAEVRPFQKQEVAAGWVPHRPSDFKANITPAGVTNGGRPGPDQGYALHLAERMEERLKLTEGEDAHDVLVGAVMIGLRRASIYGRAPVLGDIELALHLFGYLAEGAPGSLVQARKRLFQGASHDYWQQRDIADMAPESTLRLSPAAVSQQVAADPASWRALSGFGD